MLGVAGFFMSGLDRFFQAYLVAYTFWMGVVLGSMALLMVQHLSGGVWGIVLRRPFEAAVRTFRPWRCCSCRSFSGRTRSMSGRTPKRPTIRSAEVALPEPAVLLARQAFYFMVWGTIGHLLTKWSAEHDRTGDPKLLDKLGRSRAPALSSTSSPSHSRWSTGRCR